MGVNPFSFDVRRKNLRKVLWGINVIAAEKGFLDGTLICGPYCGLVGGATGFGLGAWGDELPDNQSADAPRCPSESNGYTPPKNWDGKNSLHLTVEDMASQIKKLTFGFQLAQMAMVGLIGTFRNLAVVIYTFILVGKLEVVKGEKYSGNRWCR